MTTRHVAVGLALIASVGCDQSDPVSGPDPTLPAAAPTQPPPPTGGKPLLMFDLPPHWRSEVITERTVRGVIDPALNESVPAEYLFPPEIYDKSTFVSWGGSGTFQGSAFMSFFANWAQQQLDLSVYRDGTLLGRNIWVETGASLLPKHSSAFTNGSLNVGVTCNASGNGYGNHAAEVRFLTSQAWSTLARVEVSSADHDALSPCAPPPTCTVKPQTSVSSTARIPGLATNQLTLSDFEQCPNPPPPGGGGPGGGGGSGSGYVCYEVWLIYPDTGVEVYLGDVCFEEYAT